MFDSAKKQLIKDLIIVAIAITITTVLAISMDTYLPMAIIIGLAFGGFPFGWRWCSKIFSAFSLYALIAKFFISLFLGWIAIFVVIGKDIFNLIQSKEC